jgi:putative aldouronate transport system permease protein
VKLSRGEKIFEVFNYIFLAIGSLLFIIPFWSVVGTSFVSSAEWAQRGAFVLVPRNISLDAYRMFLGKGSVVFHAYGVTLLRVTVGTFLNLCFTISMAYALARRDLPGRDVLTLIVFITMVFSGGLIPTYLLVDSLGLVDTFWAMIIPGLINPWWLLIMRNFFAELPRELEDAALIDGATPVGVLLRVYLPLSLPSIATIGLFYAVWHWNSWFDAAIYLQERSKYPIQLILREVLYMSEARDHGTLRQLTQAEMPMLPPAKTMQSAMIVVSTVPILCVYPYIQRYFVKGVMVGSIKG